MPFPAPSDPIDTRAEVFLRYLDFFRSRLVDKVSALSEDEARSSRLPSGWTPIALAKHLTYVEMRWLELGFLGAEVADPWGDQREDRWYVTPDEPIAEVIAALQEGGRRSREIVEANDLAGVGAPGERWEGDDPPSLERILFHLLQEYARHAGHLDIVVELAGGPNGE